MPIRNSGELVHALWKSAQADISTSLVSELDDSGLLRANQFVCHAPPANPAGDDRVRKIYDVEERDENR